MSGVLQFIWHYIDVAGRGVTFWPTRYLNSVQVLTLRWCVQRITVV